MSRASWEIRFGDLLHAFKCHASILLRADCAPSMRRSVSANPTRISEVRRLNTVSQKSGPYMRADQMCGCRDQISVVPCLLPIRQQRDVFKPGSDAMPSIEPASI